MVNSVGQKGFFADGSELSAWNSLAGHSRGLKVLQKNMSLGRYKTRTEPIDIPYRHGILHGMDLGFDNKLVAAKCWAALLAAGEWAIKIERGEKNAPAANDEPGFLETLKSYAKTLEASKTIDAWKPRELVLGEHFKESGPLEEYEAYSPERALYEYLCFWKDRNYGKMVPFLPHRNRRSMRKAAGELRETFRVAELHEFKFLTVVDEAPIVAVIDIKCLLKIGDQAAKEKILKFRMVYLSDDERLVLRGEPGGAWTVMNWGHVWRSNQ
jgi:hypothetical protein